jgi:membrane protein DedA with SNARE-associated domain
MMREGDNGGQYDLARFLAAMSGDDGFGIAGPLLGWLAAHTYAAVFVGTLVDASGLPFPGRLLLVAAGALAGAGRKSTPAVIALAATAAVVMDHVWYAAAAWGHERLLRLYRRLGGALDGSEETGLEYFTRFGAATVLVGRFFTSVRAVAWPVAVARGLSYPRFLALDVLAAAIWASVWVLLGWVMGGRWRTAAEITGPWLAVAGVMALAITVWPLLTRLWRRKRRAAAAAARAK